MQEHTPEYIQPQFEFPEIGPNPSGLCMCGCGRTTAIATRSYKKHGIVKGQHVRFLRGHCGGHAPILEPSVRFWKYVTIDTPDKCWLWNGGNNGRFGYGVFFDGNRLVGAHRFSWQLHFGPIPNGLHVLHRCDNPPCVNPNHLFLGSNHDNHQDKIAKGRAKGLSRPGTSNPFAKLNETDVQKIRHAFANGSSARELAHKYDVTDVTIYNILTRKAWSHVP